MHTDYKLAPNFWLSELTVSQAAARLGMRNEPFPPALDNLRRLAQYLEVVRANLGGNPVLISSGYRSAEVNALVGGSRASAHLDGRAVDFTCPGFGSPREVCAQLITVGLVFDQLIYEGAWVHLGLPVWGEEPRQQVLTAVFGRGRPTAYLKGLV